MWLAKFFLHVVGKCWIFLFLDLFGGYYLTFSLSYLIEFNNLLRSSSLPFNSFSFEHRLLPIFSILVAFVVSVFLLSFLCWCYFYFINSICITYTQYHFTTLNYFIELNILLVSSSFSFNLTSFQYRLPLFFFILLSFVSSVLLLSFLCLMFFILFLGNTTTTIMCIYVVFTCLWICLVVKVQSTNAFYFSWWWYFWLRIYLPWYISGCQGPIFVENFLILI